MIKLVCFVSSTLLSHTNLPEDEHEEEHEYEEEGQNDEEEDGERDEEKDGFGDQKICKQAVVKCTFGLDCHIFKYSCQKFYLMIEIATFYLF